MQGTSGNNDSEHLSLDDGGLSKSPVEAGEGRGSSVFSKPEDHDTKQLFSSQDSEYGLLLMLVLLLVFVMVFLLLLVMGLVVLLVLLINIFDFVSSQLWRRD